MVAECSSSIAIVGQNRAGEKEMCMHGRRKSEEMVIFA